MIVLLEVKAFLTALGSLGTLTVGSMPASPDVIGTIYEYGGKAPEKGFGIIGIQYEHPAIQVVFRGVAADYLGPRTKAEIAWKALGSVVPGPIVSGSAIYLRIDPQQSPFPTAPPDANNRIYIGFNCYVFKEPTA